MTTPLISVMMPFRNSGATFAAAVQSIAKQTYENWELLLCDDGSSDHSLALAQSLRDPRVVVWSDGKRLCLAARLNQCIDRARGEYIARMDSDDLSYPDRLRRQLEFLQQNPEVDLVGCRMVIFTEDGTPIGKRRLPVEHSQIAANPSLGFGIAHPTWMARTSWFRSYRYDANAVRYEDVELLYRAHQASRFANIPEVLYAYRETRGGFHKRLTTRIGRVRHLRAVGRQRLGGMFYKAALAESIKAALDAAVTFSSARYWMLQLREEPLTMRDQTNWDAVVRSLQT